MRNLHSPCRENRCKL